MSGETESNVSGWTTDTLHLHMQQQIDGLAATMGYRLADLIHLLDERYNTQTKAVDAAFAAQQVAMMTALAAAEKAVSTALDAAEKAVAKSELAADKRFESVNEFRAQLADQVATFVSRVEMEVQLARLADQVTAVRTEADARLRRNGEGIIELSQRIDRTEGRARGLAAGWTYLVAFIGVAATLIAIYVAISQ